MQRQVQQIKPTAKIRTTPPPAPGAIVVHKTKMTGYRVRGYGKMKVNGDWCDCIHYESADGNDLYTRTREDFDDNFVATGFCTSPTPPSKP